MRADEKVKNTRLGLFQAYGIELEYMIVDKDTLDVKPITDQLIHEITGSYDGEVDRGFLSWTNEVALHVLEFKTTHPAPTLLNLELPFQEEVCKVNQLLEHHHARLMPTAMHPWMNPNQELRIWPHDYNVVYEAFHKVFDCTGHGWANVQSTHINLPFSNEEEFVRLHTAIRMILPLIPGLAASSPIVEGKISGLQDNRLEFYRHNSSRIPSITGSIIPEACLSFKDYEEKIFQRIYADIAPHDPKGILQHEWLNARGAITRFQRYAIEIRLIDIQEAPKADLAIVAAVTAAIHALVEEKWIPLHICQRFSEEFLFSLLLKGIHQAEHAEITDPHYLSVFGWNKGPCTCGELWRHIIPKIIPGKVSPTTSHTLQFILDQGTLSTRLLKDYRPNPHRANLKKIYQRLCDHLQEGTLYGE